MTAMTPGILKDSDWTESILFESIFASFLAAGDIKTMSIMKLHDLSLNFL